MPMKARRASAPVGSAVASEPSDGMKECFQPPEDPAPARASSVGSVMEEPRRCTCSSRTVERTMASRSLIVLVAALLLVLAVAVFIVALGDYLFQPIPVQ